VLAVLNGSICNPGRCFVPTLFRTKTLSASKSMYMCLSILCTVRTTLILVFVDHKYAIYFLGVFQKPEGLGNLGSRGNCQGSYLSINGPMDGISGSKRQVVHNSATVGFSMDQLDLSALSSHVVYVHLFFSLPSLSCEASNLTTCLHGPLLLLPPTLGREQDGVTRIWTPYPPTCGRGRLGTMSHTGHRTLQT